MVTSNALRRSTLLRSTLAGRNPEDRICFCTSPKEALTNGRTADSWSDLSLLTSAPTLLIPAGWFIALPSPIRQGGQFQRLGSSFILGGLGYQQHGKLGIADAGQVNSELPDVLVLCLPLRVR